MMMRKSSAILMGVILMFCLVVWGQPVKAQNYPNQPIQLVVPMAPGDTVDLSGRAIAAEMEKILKTPVVTINKPGGGSTIGANYAARAKKDGYTVLFANSNIYYAAAMDPETVPYNPLTDLEPLCLAVSVPLTIPVLADSPWKTFQELMTYMKQNPGKIRGSSSGVGSVGHFNFEVIRIETGNTITMIPYKGASPAMVALLGGHVETSTLSLSLIAPHVQAGKLRILLISQKSPEYPKIPTLKELGYKRDIMSVRFAFYVQAGLPDSVKKVLVPAIQKSIKAPEVVKAIQNMGAIEDFVPGEEFKKMMTEEYDMAQQLMKKAASPSK
jgi:tripartite-type tricarboxylate transporter receptor subunit TctC